MPNSNEELVQKLIDDGYLETPIIIEAFREVDRADFVPEERKEHAYLNQALPIGEGQTISQPLTVAFMLELLSPATGEKILDIGTGSAWAAALLSYIVGKNDKQEQGKIVTVERIESLKEMAEENLKKYPELTDRVEFILGDGSQGYKLEAPYDKIVAAAAGSQLPEPWKKQLKVDGRIVAPAGSSMHMLEKTGEDEFEEKKFFGFSFVPLVTNTD